MDNDECPGDSTVVLMDDGVIMDHYPPTQHNGATARRSFDEPQTSSRVTSTTGVVHFGPGNYPLHQDQQQHPQLPPLPKLIFGPSMHAGLYPTSLSFSSSSGSGGGWRIGSASRSELELGGSRPTTSFPSSRSASGSQQQSGNLPLPRLVEGLSRRSELTISRVVGSTPSINDNLSRMGISSTCPNEIPVARVGGGVSISRVEGSASTFSRVTPPSSSMMMSRLELPSISRGGQGGVPPVSSRVPPQLEITPFPKFRRRFLTASPSPAPGKSQSQNLSRLPMVVSSSMRTSSTKEYFSSGHGPSEDSLAIGSEAAMDFTTRRPHSPPASSSSSYANAISTTILGSGTTLTTSQQGSQRNKLHISKKTVEVIEEVDDTSSEQSCSISLSSMSSSLQYNLDSNIGLAFDLSSPPSISVSANNSSSSSTSVDEMSVKSIKHNKVSNLRRFKIPDSIVTDDDEADEDVDEDSKDAMPIIASDAEVEVDDESRPGTSHYIEHMIIKKEKEKGTEMGDPSRWRSRRKRQPSPTVNQTPPKGRRKRGAAPPPDQEIIISPEVSSTDSLVGMVVEAGVGPRGGRGRGTGRGRARPRGSTNKAKLERLAQLQTTQEQPHPQEIETEVELEPVAPTEPVADTTTQLQDVNESLPLEGDPPEVNAEISSASSSPAKKTRGSRRGWGTDGPRGSSTLRSPPAAPRGTRGSRGFCGVRKFPPEAKKLKLEKKETIKAPPPPVQVFEEETRMSADIKAPVPDRITTLVTPPVVVDEESGASNVSSSTSISTTAKTKRFTKDPIIEERKPVTAETLYEYQWPLNDKNADFYFLQEQISEYLGVKSFKRRYPDIQRRRVVDMEERDFLRDSKGVVSETQCNLGLTAVYSCEVLDIMVKDFSDKYEEYIKIFQERKKEQEMAKLKPQKAPAVRDSSAEFRRRTLKSCAKWNSGINRERKDKRVGSFDLQTDTLHCPQKTLRTPLAPDPERTKMRRYYPVAVLPGQFTDNYKKYTPDELNYLPLNSVRYGPVSENWTVNSDSSDESSSDSDDLSSSSDDDSSSTSSDDDLTTSVGESDQNQVDCGKVLYRGMSGLTKVSTEGSCKSCDGDAYSNKDGNAEVLLHCSRCDVANHPTCLELTLDMLPFITKYQWECTDCKNCIECNDPADADKMLFCDCCDRGYHIYCVGLRKVPTERWHCSVCSLCYSCRVTQPSPEDRMAEWHHEFRKGKKGVDKFYLHSFCVACSKLFKKGQAL